MKGKTVLVLLSGMYISACNDNAFSGYSNYDLKEAYYECGKGGHSAAGEQRCRNIRAECETRKKERGFRC
ncbi:MAG: hypothetical protein H7A01_02980 [Hahellaceae bacterium]|jgi:hypothetical protein|nr:hypothetical protein [Hahellaceae bacterium]